jgi:hypothetical protein
MIIELPDDVEMIAKRAVNNKEYKSVEEFISHVIKHYEHKATKSESMSYDAWLDKFRNFTKDLVSRNPDFDDSRNAMYDSGRK